MPPTPDDLMFSFTVYQHRGWWIAGPLLLAALIWCLWGAFLLLRKVASFGSTSPATIVIGKRGIITVTKSKNGWRWRAKANNGEIVAINGQGLSNKGDGEEAARKYGPPGFDVVVK